MSTLPEVEPYISTLRKSKAFGMAIRELMRKHKLEFHYIMEGMKKKTGEL